uniref:Serpin peptidase inhibitor, clade I (neuroserpin), member 1 n=1 Tax=Hucho hucho TaxID=62062 RepID=A0A4W5KXZ5_9TELE
MLIIGLLPLLLLPGPGCRAADIPEDTTAEFSVRLYHQLQARAGDDNIIFSPLSVAVALGMVELGARGASLTQIRQAVGFSHLPTGIHTAEHTHSHLPTGIHTSENAHTLTQPPTYRYTHCRTHTLTATYLPTGIHTAEHTHTHPPTYLQVYTPQNTHTHSHSHLPTGEFSDGSSEAGGVYQVLEMPYEGEDMSMLVVLPRQEVPLAALEPIIRAPLLEEWANNVKRQKVEVYLPNAVQKLNLKPQTANGKDLFIGKAVQKAYLEVTEEGAEGAAGSGMIALTRTLVLYPQVMADHPFFFIIRNRRTGSILFMGRVMTPEVIDPTDFDNDSM